MTKNRSSVGYGRPPPQHRFKPGKSGNPSGRRRGSRNFKSDLSEELSEIISVNEAGVIARLSKQRAFIKRICAQALSGDARAMAQLAGLILRLLPPEEHDGDNPAPMEASDEAIIARFLQRAPQSAAQPVRKGRNANAKP